MESLRVSFVDRIRSHTFMVVQCSVKDNFAFLWIHANFGPLPREIQTPSGLHRWTRNFARLIKSAKSSNVPSLVGIRLQQIVRRIREISAFVTRVNFFLRYARPQIERLNRLWRWVVQTTWIGSGRCLLGVGLMKKFRG
jgi:hypothetical protein